MAQNIISIALIGVGGFGRRHLDALHVLQRENRIRLMAVADPAVDRIPDLHKMLLASDVRIYPDYRDMLARETCLHAVAIAAPIPFHHEMAIECVRRGLYVYLEKPPVVLLSQLNELIQADHQQRVYVGFQHIASPWMQKLKAWRTSGKFGEVRHIRSAACWPRRDSYFTRSPWTGRMTLHNRPVFDGPATNALSHLLINMTYLAARNREAYEVPDEVSAELYRARKIESYDTACIEGRFESGVRFFAALTHSTEELVPFKMRIEGTDGWAEISRDGQRLDSSWGGENYAQTTNELVYDSYLNFIEFASGKLSRPYTLLSDTRGYFLISDSLLQSSGGIHNIGPEWVRTYHVDNDIGYDVSGLREATQRGLAEGSLFAKQSCPWAIPSIAVRQLCIGPGIRLKQCLSR